MTVLAVTRRPIVLETQASGAMLTDILVRLEGILGRAALYGISDPLEAKLFTSQSVEANFATGYYREGFVLGGDPTFLTGWSFARTGVGTARNVAGTLETFATDVPRITDKGLLIERASTNLASYSVDFSNGSWIKFGSFIDANSTTAPDGTMTADALLESAVSSEHGLYRPFTAAAGQVCSWSVFAKVAQRTKLRLGISDFDTGEPTAIFDLAAGTAGAPSPSGAWSNLSTTIEPFADGWYRCTISGVKGAGTDVGGSIALINGAGDAGYLGDGASGLWIWGGQPETGAPTSYIPTTTATATRGADVANLAIPTAAEGTLFADFVAPDYFAGPPGVFGTTAGGMTPLGVLDTGVISFNGALDIVTGNVDPRTRIKAALSWTDGYRAFTFAGLAPNVSTETVGAWPVLTLGKADGYLGSYIRSIMILDAPRTASQLQAMTA